MNNKKVNNLKYSNTMDIIFYDINRIILQTLIVFVNFLLFQLIKLGDQANKHLELSKILVGVLMINLYKPQVKKHTYYKISSLVFFLSYLILPILHKLTIEVCSDTIYFWHFVCQLVYIGNSVSFAIQNIKIVKREYKENEVLSLEDSINIPKKLYPNMISGYVAVTISIILLSSRLQNLSSVFCYLTSSLIIYIFLPKLQEEHKIYKNFYKTLFCVLSVSYLAYTIERTVFYIFISIIIYFYVFMCVLKVLF